MSIEDLEKELNSQKLQTLYLFYGEELFLLDSAVKKIKAPARPELWRQIWQ